MFLINKYIRSSFSNLKNIVKIKIIKDGFVLVYSLFSKKNYYNACMN